MDLTIKLFALALQRVVYEPLVQNGECLTQVQENCLRFIYYHQTPMVKEVAEGLQISNAAVTKLVDRLEKKGLVRREFSRTDRRQILLSLTPAGIRLLEDARQQSLQRLQAVVARLTPESLAALEQSLHDFLAATLIDIETLDQICLHCGLAHLNECPGNLICRELTGRDRVPS